GVETMGHFLVEIAPGGLDLGLDAIVAHLLLRRQILADDRIAADGRAADRHRDATRQRHASDQQRAERGCRGQRGRNGKSGHKQLPDQESRTLCRVAPWRKPAPCRERRRRPPPVIPVICWESTGARRRFFSSCQGVWPELDWWWPSPLPLKLWGNSTHTSGHFGLIGGRS